MPTKKFKPITPSLRQRQVLTFDHLDSKLFVKSLLKPSKVNAGRNNTGRITVRHRGGTVKRLYRVVDFNRSIDNVKARVVSIQYDPNRSANIALISYLNGKFSYIVAPNGLKIGDFVESGKGVDIKTGNCLPLSDIPVGTSIHNIEISIKSGAKMVRSAGVVATILGKNTASVIVRLPSGEVRAFNPSCKATIGQVGEMDHRNQVRGKAGASRWRGWRPQVRGSVMNPCDHPHGGGEGKSPVGRKSPRTPWGKPALGKKTRNSKKSRKNILTDRKR